MAKEQEKEKEVGRDMAWLKSLLNNMPLLKWVKKYTADNLLEDNTKAQSYGITTYSDSVTVADSTLTKLLVTHSKFEGKELQRFSAKQISDVLALLGDKGELIITDSKYREMVIQIGDTSIVVCPLIKQDK